MGDTKALPVIIELTADSADYDEPQWQIRCPHPGCGNLDAFREVDIAIRWNTCEEFEIEGGKIVFAPWGTGDSDFQHNRYECEGCGNPVEMDIEDEEWS